MRKNLYTTIIGQLVKKGKKRTAVNIFNEALKEVAQKTNKPVLQIMKILAKRLGSVIEIKTVRLRKNVHIIPFPVRNERRYYLIARNLVSVVSEDKSKTSLKQKLVEEIYAVIENKPSKTLQKKESLVKSAINNKANIHYRW